jgi:hypothetical protein
MHSDLESVSGLGRFIPDERPPGVQTVRGHVTKLYSQLVVSEAAGFMVEVVVQGCKKRLL